MDCSLKLVHANISLHYVYGCTYKYKKWMNQIKVKSAYTCFLFVYIYTLVVCCSFPCFVTVKKDMLLKNVCCHLYNDKNVVLRWILMHICSLSIWLSQTDSHTNTNIHEKRPMNFLRALLWFTLNFHWRFSVSMPFWQEYLSSEYICEKERDFDEEKNGSDETQQKKWTNKSSLLRRESNWNCFRRIENFKVCHVSFVYWDW